MASVFLSYDRDDTSRARHFAQVLEKAGHQVWWDLHVRGGAQFSKVIEEALKAADVVVVLWSANSIESAWVRDEAASGRDTRRLVPVTIDGTEPPLGFRQFQTIDLSRWKGRGTPAAMRVFLADVECMAGPRPEHAPDAAAAGDRSAAPVSRPWVGGAIIAVAAMLLVGALWLWRPWARDNATVIAVAAAKDDPQSRELARDLAVKLGSLAAAHSESMRLISGEDGPRSRPDLILQAASVPAATGAGSSLVLMSGKDRSILWSKDFDPPATGLADLKQQIALTSGGVLDCAMEGMEPHQRLKLDTLKIYLNACAQIEDVGAVDPRPVIPMFESVVEQSPRFLPAWRRLLMAESEIVGTAPNEGESADPQLVRRLREHIRRADALEPDMSEALIAKAALLPPRDFVSSTALYERAARQSPDNAAVLSAYAAALGRVGQTRESVKLAGQVARLAPLSPRALGGHILALAYSGRFELAERELREAERLWPGTAMVRDARYRYYYRYGDPKVAMEMPESDAPGGMPRLFLKTRIDPSPANIQAFLARADQVLARMRNPTAGVGFITVARGTFGHSDELFPLLLNWPKADDVAVLSEVFYRPELKQFRQDPRFMAVARRAGLLDYWQKSGNWPDFCFEADMPYDCKKEAAKLAA